MGLFEKMRGSQGTETLGEMSAAEAFAAIALAAVASDGYLSEEEAQSIPFILSRMKLYEAYSDDMMRRLFDRLLATLQKEGVGALFASAKASLSEELQQTAFAVAADLVLADGVFAEEEKQFLNELQAALEIAPDFADKITDVMQIKNRG